MFHITSHNVHGITILAERTNDFRCGSTFFFLPKYVEAYIYIYIYIAPFAQNNGNR
jgi:hypothetical protein